MFGNICPASRQILYLRLFYVKVFLLRSARHRSILRPTQPSIAASVTNNQPSDGYISFTNLSAQSGIVSTNVTVANLGHPNVCHRLVRLPPSERAGNFLLLSGNFETINVTTFSTRTVTMNSIVKLTKPSVDYMPPNIKFFLLIKFYSICRWRIGFVTFWQQNSPGS